MAWKSMPETIEQFIVRRRGELDEELFKLQSAMRVVEIEKEKIDRIAMMLGTEPEPEHQNGASSFQNSGFPIFTRSAKRASEATIKEMVLDILKPPCEGGTALQILNTINTRIDAPYPRTSLSPQLSRLKSEGKIHREGLVWKWGPSSSAGNNQVDDDLGLKEPPHQYVRPEDFDPLLDEES